MVRGVANRILRVNLSDGRVRVDEPDEAFWLPPAVTDQPGGERFGDIQQVIERRSRGREVAAPSHRTFEQTVQDGVLGLIGGRAGVRRIEVENIAVLVLQKAQHIEL